MWSEAEGGAIQLHAKECLGRQPLEETRDGVSPRAFIVSVACDTLICTSSELWNNAFLCF